MTESTKYKKDRNNECYTSHCSNQKAPGKNYCHSCRKRLTTENNPARVCFNILKQNAKRRNKDFSLTFDQFHQFCEETSYLDKKGRTKRKLAIDRIDVLQGYHIWNIQTLTTSRNCRKRNEEYSEVRIIEEINKQLPDELKIDSLVVPF